MKRLGITQRVDVHATYQERRDCLDQAWSKLALELGFLPIPLPNAVDTQEYNISLDLQLDAIILSGGNSLSFLREPDSAPERDKLEFSILDQASAVDIPVLGVCRGMQAINHYFGGKLRKVDNHIGTIHPLQIKQGYPHLIPNQVNSFHSFGIHEHELADALIPLALDTSQNVEAFKHKTKPIYGIMWHPERNEPFDHIDLVFLKKILL